MIGGDQSDSSCDENQRHFDDRYLDWMPSDTELRIAQYLEAFSDDITFLVQQLRDYLKEETNPTIEIVGDSTISVNIGYGFTEMSWDCYCAIIVYSKHINISFPSGAFLSDPIGLLQGTGKRIRHIRVDKLNELKSRGVRNLLAEARKMAVTLAIEKPKEDCGVRTIVKQIKGIKKRPSI